MKIDKLSPIFPTPYEIEDVAALQALERGEADQMQQKRALNFIINTACGTYDNTIHLGSDGSRESDIAQGKRFVGLTLVKLIKISLMHLKESKIKTKKSNLTNFKETKNDR